MTAQPSRHGTNCTQKDAPQRSGEASPATHSRSRKLSVGTCQFDTGTMSSDIGRPSAAEKSLKTCGFGTSDSTPSPASTAAPAASDRHPRRVNPSSTRATPKRARTCGLIAVRAANAPAVIGRSRSRKNTNPARPSSTNPVFWPNITIHATGANVAVTSTTASHPTQFVGPR